MRLLTHLLGSVVFFVLRQLLQSILLDLEGVHVFCKYDMIVRAMSRAESKRDDTIMTLMSL